MANTGKTGTIALPTFSAQAIWTDEILGQLSDGMWENSRPLGHWKFWQNLEVVTGAPAVTRAFGCWAKKTAYNLAALYEYVGGRILAQGRMAKACELLGVPYVPGCAEYLDEMTTEEFLRGKATGAWKYDFLAGYFDKMPEELERAFRVAKYTTKDRNADIKAIKAAMKSVA